MMRIVGRGLGDDTAPADSSVSIDVGQVATWGWYGVALMLAVVYLGPRLFGTKKKTRKRRK